MVSRLLCLAMAVQLAAAAETYAIRPMYTNISFTVTKWKVLPEEGQFRQFEGSLNYDAAHPEQSSVEVSVEARSIDTKNATRDGVLRSDDFFDVQRFPLLTFRSVSVHQAEPGSLRVTGDLTIHGTTRRITFQAMERGVQEIPKVGRLTGFVAAFTISRRDFGVNGTRWGAIPAVLSDEVEIHLAIGAIKKRE